MRIFFFPAELQRITINLGTAILPPYRLLYPLPAAPGCDIPSPLEGQNVVHAHQSGQGETQVIPCSNKYELLLFMNEEMDSLSVLLGGTCLFFLGKAGLKAAHVQTHTAYSPCGYIYPSKNKRWPWIVLWPPACSGSAILRAGGSGEL